MKDADLSNKILSLFCNYSIFNSGFAGLGFNNLKGLKEFAGE